MTGQPAQERTRLAAVLAGLFFATLTMRPQVVGIGPMIPRIQDDLGVSFAVAGLLTTVPILCMGLFAPLAAVIGRWFGIRTGIGASLLVLGAFGLVRAASPGAISMIALTVGIGTGAALLSALLPAVVKAQLPQRPAVATGVYAAGMQVGSTIGAAVAVPLAVALGSWRGTLAAFSVPTLLVALAWLVGSPARPAPEASPGHRRTERAGLPLSHGVVWLLALTFGLHSACFYGLNAWLAAYLIEYGWADGTAGAALGLMNACGIAGTLLVPQLVDRAGSRRLYLTSSAGMMAATIAMLLWFPDLAWFWLVPLGVALGASFSVLLTLPLDIASRPTEAAGAAGLMMAGGYVLAAIAPGLLGLLGDLTGTLGAALAALAVLSSLLLLAVLTLSPRRLVPGHEREGRSDVERESHP